MIHLLRSRKFAPLFWCQFFAAFNDNALKTALVFLILFQQRNAPEALVTLASAIFIAPYFFLSALGGELADKFDKALIAQRLKFAEIFVAALAALGFVTERLDVLFAALALFGVIAAMFGPIKYGILPDHLPSRDIPTANALVEGATFVAILLGTIAGGAAFGSGGEAKTISAVVIVSALACWAAARLIPATDRGEPRLRVRANIAASTAGLITHVYRDDKLWWGTLVTSWFWLVGIVTLSLLPPLIKVLLGGNEHAVTAYLAMFSVAVGAGSALAAVIARGRIVLRTTLAGAVLLGASALYIALAASGAAPRAAAGPQEILSSARGIHIALGLAGLAIAGGLYIVPSFAALQIWSGADRRARTVAAANILNAAAMTCGTVIVALLQWFGATLPMLFAGMGALTLAVSVWIWRTMPRVE